MVEENVFDPLAVQTKKTITRQRIAKSPSLLKIQEKTRLRRGRAKPIPLLTPDPDPITLPIDPIPITKPISPPPPPPPPKELFVTVGNTKFFSERDFLAEQKLLSPCGDNAPFAVEHTGQQRKFCTFGDFSDAGYKLPSPLPRKTRGKLCPKGETYWGGKCKEISFSEATFF